MDTGLGAFASFVPHAGAGRHGFIDPKNVGELDGHPPACEPAHSEVILHDLGDEAGRHHALDDDGREAKLLRLFSVRVIVLGRS
jgi:hypothetical protein